MIDIAGTLDEIRSGLAGETEEERALAVQVANDGLQLQARAASGEDVNDELMQVRATAMLLTAASRAHVESVLTRRVTEILNRLLMVAVGVA